MSTYFLQQSVQNLEKYENAKFQITNSLEKIDKETNKPISIGSHVSVKNNLKSGQELLIELGGLQAELNQLSLLKSSLGETVNESYKNEIEAQCDRLKETIASLSTKTEQRVEQLDQANNKWITVTQQIETISEQIISQDNIQPAAGITKSLEDQIVEVEV